MASDYESFLKKIADEIQSGRVLEFFNKIGDSLPFVGTPANDRKAQQFGPSEKTTADRLSVT